MKTIVHVVFHAHLDPVWLWPWTAGIDEALATCRSACERLDANPDAIFTQGEAWVYDVVERTDPGLFARIKAHAEAGRWALTGGWWIQPDCNVPGGRGLQQQIAIGKAYFQSRFGAFPETAFNVDSFGHAATLPELMAEAGQKYYVMMRPQEHEMELPGRVFRWRGYADGPEVLVFRIRGSYNARELDEARYRTCLDDLPKGVGHTMCFAGLGDHGGGPTERLIQQVREARNAYPDLEIRFSSPDRFFAEVEKVRNHLPLVVGELQHHAIGCYTVHRPVKLGCRRGEHRLLQAETALANDPAPSQETAPALQKAWQAVCFHQFHDTMGGTCLPSAYRYVDGQLDGMEATVDETVSFALRRLMAGLPDCEHQRVVVWNPSDCAFDDMLEFEPWLGHRVWAEAHRLVDEEGEIVPHQTALPEALSHRPAPGRLAFRLQLDPGELRALYLMPVSGAPPAEPLPSRAGQLEVPGLASVSRVGMTLGELTFPLPELRLINDPSDTWSHGIDRYAEGGGRASWGEPQLTESGPVFSEFTQSGRIGSSDVLRQIRVHAGQAMVEIRLRVDWNERNCVLKLVLPCADFAPSTRVDGIPGAHLERALDGAERPLRDWILLANQGDGHLGVLSPEVYAVDATPERVRWTLLRSPQMAWHDPHPGGRLDGRYTDRGEHDFCFRFSTAEITPEALDARANMLQRPPALADLTRGMPAD
jgi:alpha-mannosidase